MIEWPNVELNTVTSYIKRGVSPKYVESGGYTIINQKCIRNNRVTYENSKFLSKTQKIVKEKYLQDGDVLVNSTGTGTLGRTAQYKENDEIVFCDSHVSIVRANELINKNFLSYYLYYSEPIIESYGKGATNQKELSPDDLGLIKINLPPLPTQQKIAKILSNYDDLIENNHKRIKLLEESVRLTYEEWFLRFRVEGKKLEIDPVSGLPFGWEKKKLTDVIELNPLTKVKKDLEHPFIPMSSISETNMVITDIEKRISREGTKFKNLDTLLARITPCLENGKTAFVQSLENNEVATGSTEFIVMRAKSKVSPYYVYPLARTDSFREIAIQSMSGTDGRQRVKVEIFKKVLLNIPPSKLLNQFHINMKNLFNEIEILAKKNQLIKEARDILLPRLMTGIIDTDKMDIAI